MQILGVRRDQSRVPTSHLQFAADLPLDMPTATAVSIHVEAHGATIGVAGLGCTAENRVSQGAENTYNSRERGFLAESTWRRETEMRRFFLGSRGLRKWHLPQIFVTCSVCLRFSSTVDPFCKIAFCRILVEFCFSHLCVYVYRVAGKKTPKVPRPEKKTPGSRGVFPAFLGLGRF